MLDNPCGCNDDAVSEPMIYDINTWIDAERRVASTHVYSIWIPIVDVYTHVLARE